VSSLDSYRLTSSSDPELAVATVRALKRSRNELTHSEKSYKPMILIAVLAIIQFYRTRELGDIDESIDALVDLCNSDAAVQPDCHRAAAQTFLKRFDLTRNIEDLNQACHHFEHELRLHPDNAVLECVGALSSFGTVLSTRFWLLGEREDLKRAIKSHEEALVIRRTDPDAGASLAFQLEELANDLVKEFEEYGEPSQPEGILTAIDYLREVVEFRSPGHPLRNHSVTCLCRALTVYLYVHRQVNTKGIDTYLHWSAELIGEALNVDEQSSDQEPVERIAVLAFAVRVIAERGGFELTPLVERIVTYLSQAINGVDNDHPSFVGIYQNTAVLYLKSFFALDKAFQHFQKAAKHRLGTLRERLSAAVEWAAEARVHQA
jgi:tetratricopeptide (TPR) repeat protein